MSDSLLIAVVEAGLTPNQREAFIDTQLLGRTYRDVADYMGCSHQNVAQLVTKARKKLARTEAALELREAA